MLKLLDELGEQELNLSLATCCTLIRGLYEAGSMDKAARLLEIMVRFGWVPDSTVVTDLVKEVQNDAKSEKVTEDQNHANSENAGHFLKQAAIGVAHQV